MRRMRNSCFGPGCLGTSSPGSVLKSNGYNLTMEREHQKFSSFAESDAADKEYYLSLTPAERMEILLELISRGQGDEAAKGLERVYRVVELP